MRRSRRQTKEEEEPWGQQSGGQGSWQEWSGKDSKYHMRGKGSWRGGGGKEYKQGWRRDSMWDDKAWKDSRGRDAWF